MLSDKNVKNTYLHNEFPKIKYWIFVIVFLETGILYLNYTLCLGKRLLLILECNVGTKQCKLLPE